MWCTPFKVDGLSATEAASTAEKPARTSGSVTSAPCSLETPRMTAEWAEFPSWTRQGGPPRPAQAGREHLDLAAHLLQRGHVHQAVLEDRLVQHRHPLGLREQHHQGLLPG